MSKASEVYLAVKNWLHNTQQVDRKVLDGVVKDCVHGIVKEEIAKYMQTSSFESLVRNAILFGGYGAPIGTKYGSNYALPLAQDITDKVAKQLISMFELKIK